MTNQISDQVDRSAARLDFARRLRELRVPKGFKTARSFARALGIDENRYTRYERAEVEPDLALLRKICELLRILPNDLLGGEGVDDGALLPGFAESGSPPAGTFEGAPVLCALQRCAWRLAQQIAVLQSEQDRANGNSQALEVVKHSCATYDGLMQRPYETISQLVRHPSIDAATPQQADLLRALIDQFTVAVDAAARPGT